MSFERLVSNPDRDQTYLVGSKGEHQTYPVGSKSEHIVIVKGGSDRSCERLVSIGRPASSIFYERVMREGGRRVGKLFEPTIQNNNKLADNRNQETCKRLDNINYTQPRNQQR